VRDLRIAEVVKLDMKVEDGKVQPTVPAFNCLSSTVAEKPGPGMAFKPLPSFVVLMKMLTDVSRMTIRAILEFGT